MHSTSSRQLLLRAAASSKKTRNRHRCFSSSSSSDDKAGNILTSHEHHHHQQRRPLKPFVLERFDGWNDCTMSLSASECEALTMKELLTTYADEEGLTRWDQLSLGYVEPSNGSEFLREEILRAPFQTPITTPALNPDCVNVCAPQEGIFLAMHAICEPGDHIIVTAPAYQSLYEIASSLGCQVDYWWPEEEQVVEEEDGSSKSMKFHPDTLQKLLQKQQKYNNKTKLVVGNFPHNPTGAVPTPEEFQSMVNMVEENGSWFLVDEMYRGLEHNMQQPLPTIANSMSKGISLGGMSKSYGLPGLRIGWLVNGNDDKFQKRVAELKDYLSICPPAPSEVLAFIALRSQDELWKRSHDIIANNLPLLRRFIQQQRDYKFEWYEPQGGTFAWIKFHHHHQSATTATTVHDYCSGVRKRTGLMMIDSTLFPEWDNTTARDSRIRLTYGKIGIEEKLRVWDQDLNRSREV